MTKQAVKWKEVDACMQIVALVIPVLVSIVTISGAPLLMLYLTIGGVQLISAIVHAVQKPSRVTDSMRRNYNIALVTLIVLAVVGAPTGLILIAGFIALFVTPFMAIIYFWITIQEWNRMKRILKEEARGLNTPHHEE